MTATYDDVPPNAGLIPYRVGQLESFRRDTEDWRREVDDDRGELKHMSSDLKTIKRVAVSLLIAMVGGSASITVAVLLATRTHA